MQARARAGQGSDSGIGDLAGRGQARQGRRTDHFKQPRPRRLSR